MYNQICKLDACMFRLAFFIPQNQIQCDNRTALCVTWTMTNMCIFESRAKTNIRNGSCFLLNLVALNNFKVRRKRETYTAQPKCNKCICLWFSSLLALGTTFTTRKWPTEKTPFKRYQLNQVTFLMAFFLCEFIAYQFAWKMNECLKCIQGFFISTFYFTYFCGIQTKTACKKSLLFE